AEIVDVDEVALDRHAVGILHDRDGAALDVTVGRLRPYEIAPARPAEHVLAERQLIAEVVLLHDPRRAQAAAVHVVLDVVLLQHHFLEDLRQRVARTTITPALGRAREARGGGVRFRRAGGGGGGGGRKGAAPPAPPPLLL